MSFYNELLRNIKMAKKQDLDTEKFKIFAAGMGQAMLVEDIITERQFEKLLGTLELSGNDIAAVSELAGYGDFIDDEDKEGLEFDAD